MKIEIEIADDYVQRAVTEAVQRSGGDWRRVLTQRAEALVTAEVGRLDLTEPARAASRLVDEVLNDVVRQKLRYVVKLAVDRELEVSRVAEQVKGGAA